ncbi:membrane protein [Pseudomonas sp. S60]|uniref:YciC family protein n=1 Tax=Pseudomonas sp. S60 TaxID=211124 RepID=UPI001912A2B5|nr:YciC family protein [Pseudomonas sp. S60]MBK5010518.1 membrane protein [Pseudomonas sp. S60]
MNPLSVLRDSLSFFYRHLGAILPLCLPLVVLEALITQLLYRQLGDQASPAYGMLISLLCYPLYSAALILFLDTRSNGQVVANRDLLARAVQLWPPLALLILISSLLIMAGLALFVIPGVWIMVNLVFVEYLLVLRGLPTVQAMRESARMTTGHFMRILVCMVGALAPIWLIDGLMLLALPDPSPGTELVMDSLSGFLQLYSTVVLYRLFMLLEGQQAA